MAIEKQNQAPETQDTAQGAQTDIAAGFDEKKKEMTDRVEALFKKHVSAANPDLSERGWPELEKLKMEQVAAIEKLFNERKRDYETRAAGIADMTAERLAFLDEILAGATAEAETKLRLMEGAIEKTKTGEKVGSADAGKVERAIRGVEKMMAENPGVQETGLKLMEGKDRADELTSADYNNLAALLKPYEIATQSADAKSSFEATAAGTLLGLMSPEQRYRLMQVFMDSGRRGETVQVMDGLLSTGMLSRDQGESLMKEAIAKGVLTQQQYDADFKAKLEQGYYDEEVRKYRELIGAEDRRKYSGMYAENIMNRVVGRPLVGGLLALWGIILTTLNVAANWRDKKAMLKNPYIYAGLAGAAAGTEIATGTLSKTNPWFGAGVVSRGLDAAGGIGEKERTSLEIETRGKIAGIILNAPAPLVAYLDEGGYGTMLELRKEKAEKGERPIVTVDELIQKEKAKGNDARAGRLAQLKGMSFVSEETVNLNLNIVAEGGEKILKIENNEAFAELAQEVRATQKPGGAEQAAEASAPTAVASATPPPTGKGPIIA